MQARVSKYTVWTRFPLVGNVNGRSGGTTFEIDVVAESSDKTTLLVGECKWNEHPMNVSKLMDDLREKAEMLPIAQNKKILPVLFLKRSRGKEGELVIDPEEVVGAGVAL